MVKVSHAVHCGIAAEHRQLLDQVRKLAERQQWIQKTVEVCPLYSFLVFSAVFSVYLFYGLRSGRSFVRS